MKKGTISFKVLACSLLVIFVAVFALKDVFLIKNASASELVLPAPTKLLKLSQEKSGIILRGIQFDQNNPFDLEFLFSGSKKINKQQAEKLVDYFLLALSVPSDKLWVNLSPFEQDRVIDPLLEKTNVAKVLLSQDYLLKQISSSLTHPDSKIGNIYWNAILESNKADTSLVESFNKVWIAPDKAEVAVEGDLVLIKESSLKVLTEKDYLALNESGVVTDSSSAVNKAVNETLIPALEKEINKGKNFIPLRELYSALILGTWFKENYFSSIYNQYIDSEALAGLNENDPALKDKVFSLYADAFKKGVYNYIKKETTGNGKSQKRHYFSGGIVPSPNVSASALIKEDFVNIAMTKFSFSFLPKLNSRPFLRTMLLSMIILFGTFIPELHSAVPIIDQLATNQTRAVRADVNEQTAALDAAIATAANTTALLQDRVNALQLIGASNNRYYFEQLETILETDPDSTIQGETILSFIGMKTFKAVYALQNYWKRSDIEKSNSKRAINTSGTVAEYLFKDSLWFDGDSLIADLFKEADINTQPDWEKREDAWASLGFFMDNSSTENYNKLIDIKSRETKQYVIDQADYVLPMITARDPKLLLKNIIPDGADHDTLVTIAVNEGPEFTSELRATVVDTLGINASFKGVPYTPAQDSVAWHALNPLLDTTRAYASRESDPEFQEKLKVNLPIIWARFNGVSNTIVKDMHKQQYNARASYPWNGINQMKINLPGPSVIGIYNVQGRLITTLRAEKKGEFVINKSRLRGMQLAKGMYVIKVRPAIGQRSDAGVVGKIKTVFNSKNKTKLDKAVADSKKAKKDYPANSKKMLARGNIKVSQTNSVRFNPRTHHNGVAASSITDSNVNGGIDMNLGGGIKSSGRAGSSLIKGFSYKITSKERGVSINDLVK